jgi:hypothetical protein
VTRALAILIIALIFVAAIYAGWIAARNWNAIAV